MCLLYTVVTELKSESDRIFIWLLKDYIIVILSQLKFNDKNPNINKSKLTFNQNIFLTETVKKYLIFFLLLQLKSFYDRKAAIN